MLDPETSNKLVDIAKFKFRAAERAGVMSVGMILAGEDRGAAVHARAAWSLAREAQALEAGLFAVLSGGAA